MDLEELEQRLYRPETKYEFLIRSDVVDKSQELEQLTL